MSADLYDRLGFDFDEVEGATKALKSANGSALNVKGITDPITFELDGHACKFQFIVVKFLNSKIILGRDFILFYDLIIDLGSEKIYFKERQSVNQILDPRRRNEPGEADYAVREISCVQTQIRAVDIKAKDNLEPNREKLKPLEQKRVRVKLSPKNA